MSHLVEFSTKKISFCLLVLSTIAFSISVAPVWAQQGFCTRVPVLLYHHVEPISQARLLGHQKISVDSSWFEKQMAYLSASGYKTISAQDLVNSLASGNSVGGKTVVLTFDDAYSDFYTDAYPVLKKYGMVANLMVPTGLVNNPGYLSWDQLREMQASGLVFAYDHTWSHAALGKATADKMNFEVLTAKLQLEEHLGGTVTIFAYPYGSYNSKIIDFLRSKGFTAAFSTRSGVVQCQDSVMSLSRTRIGNSPLKSYGI